MASFAKYKSEAIGGVLKHNNRTSSDIIHSNEDIKSERTIFNYHIKKGTANDVTNRLSEIFDNGRKDRVVLGEMVVTLPKDVLPKDEKAFFRCVYDFYCNEFGEENIINAVVHKDENTPHIHIDFIPVVKSELTFESRNKLLLEKYKAEHADLIEKNEGKIERLCCDELIDRAYLYEMHPRLSQYVTEELGYECSIINGATEHGNKSILKLKADKLLKEIEAMENKRDILQKEIEAVLKIAEASGVNHDNIGYLPLMEKIADLESQNKIYREIISKNRYPFTSDELSRLKEKKYFPAMSSKVNVYDDNLVNLFNHISDPKPIVVIELYDKVERPLPQQRYIDNDNDLKNKVRMATRLNDGKSVTVKSSQTSDKTYIFVRTDNEDQTAMSLMELKRLLKEQEENWRGRKIYMERMESDELNIAQSILNKSNFEATLLSGKYHDENDSQEREIQKM